MYQGIEAANITKFRIEATDAASNTVLGDPIFNTYKNRYCIPLDFELLTDHGPFYQSVLTDRLTYELTFNNYSKVIKSTDSDAKYIISGISLEYEVVTSPELARMIKNQYSGQKYIR